MLSFTKVESTAFINLNKFHYPQNSCIFSNKEYLKMINVTQASCIYISKQVQGESELTLN